jgi:hypothetical protein
MTVHLHGASARTEPPADRRDGRTVHLSTSPRKYFWVTGDVALATVVRLRTEGACLAIRSPAPGHH